jgi:hypothetical protein
MSESSGEVMENFDVGGHKKALFSLLSHVLVTSKTKFDCEKADNRTRQGWARIIIGGVEAYGKLLDSIQLEQLEKRVSALESHGETINEKHKP